MNSFKLYFKGKWVYEVSKYKACYDYTVIIFILGSASLSFTDTIHGEVASASAQEIIVKNYDDTYYNNAIGKTGLELKKELHNIIDNHTKLSYSAVWEALRDTDEDPNNKNNVILLYTGRSQGNLRMDQE